ncbi:hypothetical protein [Rheinheimera pleomorphica]|uniref:hypothetical protein n=1 Tax=Rheinheimera pleomorphica TaxID=2703963 RepID=UPI00141E5948|nr:hypothetical protein [Rheinheimera pleomorphica]
MNVSQTGGIPSANNIEVSALFMLVSEVEKTTSGQIQFMQPQLENYQELSQDAA